jgi:DNA-binding transcriptional LysR family regulator
MKENLYPWLRQLTLKQMRGFVAAVNSGSASAAARELHLTPPAISLQLRDLENAIGLPLLERSESGLTTTLVGQELLELSTSIQDSLGRRRRGQYRTLFRSHRTGGVHEDFSAGKGSVNGWKPPDHNGKTGKYGA